MKVLLRAYFPVLAFGALIGLVVTFLPSQPDDRDDDSTSGFELPEADEVGDEAPSTAATAPAVDDDVVFDGSEFDFMVRRPLDDCYRKQAGFDSCPHRFEGDNQGETYRGVTGDKITVVWYEPARGDQVDAVLSESDAATTGEEIRSLIDAWNAFGNNAYGFYGREVEIIYMQGPGRSADPAAMQADATTIALELEAFAVVAESAPRSFFDELSRRGVVNVTLLSQFGAGYYDASAPYHWGLLPDGDLVLDHLAEYWCNRLADRPAAFAGDDELRGQNRKLGVIVSESSQAGTSLRGKIEEGCGSEVARIVEYGGDMSSVVLQSTNLIVQLRDAGVTTVTCLCDVVSPIFFTGAATSQEWFPEWLHNGLSAIDSRTAGRLYDQEQWANSFGPSALGVPGPVAQSAGWQAFFAECPGCSAETVRGSAYLYSMLSVLYGGIEAAGPVLDADSFGEGLADPVYFPPKQSPEEAAISYGTGGVSPFTAIDDFMEIWWDPDRVGPDGEVGTTVFVDGGRRYALTEWPDTDPVAFLDDGSPQPGPDPDL